jgi:hypothetical protein
VVLRPHGLIPQGALVLGALLSFGAFGLVPRDGLHPLALLASLLPLQLAALFWAFRGAGSRGSGSPPPASD